MPPEVRQALGIDDGMIRISVGIEDVGEIIDDITGALQAAFAAEVHHA